MPASLSGNFEVSDTIPALGSWNRNIGSCSGPCSTWNSTHVIPEVVPIFTAALLDQAKGDRPPSAVCALNPNQPVQVPSV